VIVIVGGSVGVVGEVTCQMCKIHRPPPSGDVGGGCRLAITIEAKLTSIPHRMVPPVVSLLDYGTSIGRVARVLYPVLYHLGNGDLPR
jgi:hypothetical protein